VERWRPERAADVAMMAVKAPMPTSICGVGGGGGADKDRALEADGIGDGVDVGVWLFVRD
jgi:hypothetical protein